MIKITANKDELKKAFSIASLAISSSPINPIDGHALVKVENGKLNIYATNKDMMASAVVSLFDSETQNVEFTVDPKKITNLLNSSEQETITISYTAETKTVSVFAAEDPESYLSFASLDSELFLTFTSEFEKAIEIKKIDAQVFLYGIKFIYKDSNSSFLSEDKQNKQFQNPYIDNGLIYGSDGVTRLGAFQSKEFEGIDYLVLRKTMIPSIATMIINSETPNIILKSTSRIILISSEDGIYNFGFLKISKDFEPPQFKIDLNKATDGGFNIDKELLLKRLKRLSLSSDGAMGIEISVENKKLKLKALVERDSIETMPCTVIKGENIKFIAEYRSLRNILKLFEDSNVDIFTDIKGNRYQIRSQGNLVIGDKESVQKPYLSIGIVTMSRKSQK